MDLHVNVSEIKIDPAVRDRIAAEIKRRFAVPPPALRRTLLDAIQPRVDRVQFARAVLDELNPLAIRYRDTLYLADGPHPWTVCRVDVYDGEESYLCTNGERTRRVHEDDLFDVRHMHYRDGRRVHAMQWGDHFRY